MQARWERKQVKQAMTGVMLFTHEQSKRIQTEAQTRMRLQAVRLKEQRMGKVEIELLRTELP